MFFQCYRPEYSVKVSHFTVICLLFFTFFAVVRFVLTHPSRVLPGTPFEFYMTLFPHPTVEIPATFEAVLWKEKTQLAKQIFQQQKYGLEKHSFSEFDTETTAGLFDANFQVEVKFLSGGISDSSIRNTALDIKRQKYLFIQTDKAIYKPSQPVKIVIVGLNRDLSALAKEEISIAIVDVNGNRMLERNGIRLDNYGMYELEFSLSAFSSLGDWSIEVSGVEPDVPKSSKSFTVQFYVLPNIEVTASPVDNDFFVYNNGSADPYRLKVVPEYTFGKIAKGISNVVLASSGGCNYEYDQGDKKIAFPILHLADGSPNDGIFSINNGIINSLVQERLNVEDQIMRNYPCNLLFEIGFTEEVTGRTYKAEPTVIPIYSYPLVVTAHEANPTSIKPGIDVQLNYRITKADGSPNGDRVPRLIKWKIFVENVYRENVRLPSPSFYCSMKVAEANEIPPVEQGEITIVDDYFSLPEMRFNTDVERIHIWIHMEDGGDLCETKSVADARNGLAISVKMIRDQSEGLVQVGEIVKFEVETNFESEKTFLIVSFKLSCHHNHIFSVLFSV